MIQEEFVKKRSTEKRSVTYPSSPERPRKRCEVRNDEKEEEDKT